MKKMKKDKTMSHFTFSLVKPILRFLAFFFVGYRHKDNYKIKKDEPILVLSNHQTDMDSLLVNLSFSRLLRVVTTDNLFKKNLLGFALKKFGAIPKRKGMVDPNSTMQMLRVINKKQSLLLFPEGNRTYAEFQYYLSPRFVQMIKVMKVTVVLFNLHGGNGTHPRFMRRKRRGPFYGKINKVLRYEEYKDMSDEELFSIIKDGIKVYDSESGQLYKDKKRAEYLERMFFACPQCHSAQTLYSKREIIRCQKCGFEAEFTEDLHLKTRNSQIKYTKLLDWYNYQKTWIKDLQIDNDSTIFSDQNVKLLTAQPYTKVEILAQGNMSVNKDRMFVGDKAFDLKDIEIASPVSGIKLVFTYNGQSFEIKGDKRFNPLKYVLLFHKLDTKMHLNDVDRYYTLDTEVS